MPENSVVSVRHSTTALFAATIRRFYRVQYQNKLDNLQYDIVNIKGARSTWSSTGLGKFIRTGLCASTAASTINDSPICQSLRNEVLNLCNR